LRQFTQSKTFRILAAATLLVGLYAIAGFWLAPKLLRNAVLQDIPKTLGLKSSVGEIRVNPFLFQLDVKDFSLTDPGGEKLVGFDHFFIDFDLFSSIWHRVYTFADIQIDSPFANAILSKDGRINLAQLSPKSAASKPEPKKSGPLPSLRIGLFNVNRGVVSYEDRSVPSDFTARLQPINFELRNFTTGVDGGRFTFTGTSKLGERIEWRGRIAVEPIIASDGEIKIEGLLAHTVWQYLKDRLNFQVSSGKADVTATYQFSLKDQVDLRLDVSRVELTDLGVRPKDSDSDWVKLPELLLTGAGVDLLKRQAHVDSLTLTGLKLVTWLDPDGSFNLLKLAAAPIPTAGAPAAAAPHTEPPAGAGPAWQFELREFALRDANVSSEDRSTQPATKAVLAPLSLKIQGASLDLAKALTVQLDTQINEGGSLSLTGEVTPQPTAANLDVKLNGIGLAAVQPYIAQHTSMTLLAGALSGNLKVRYGSKKPALQLGGDVSVANLHTVDNALHDDFINFERLDIQGLKFQRDPDRLEIEQVLLRKPYARVIIEPDVSINVTRVLAGPGATVVEPGGPGRAPVAATASPAPAVPARSGPRVASASAPPMPIAVKKIVFQAGQANFADLSVKPNFSTGIQKLEGTVLGLSSKANSRAKIDLHGSVDEFSPVSITGEVSVLGTPLHADVALSFRNIELSTFNPYSGKFAGYNISKGKLTTELHYKVDGRKLDAQHHIIVDQLEFGDKTDSKEAVSLPVKLAVALLKDRDGVIDLNLPVTGSLDDPKFRLGPIIWKVFVNILEKAVTAPFALLGSLFGGGPDLQFVDFQPGSADLDAAGMDKARSMVKALNGRPQLKIEVPIAVIAALDGPRLTEARFQAQIQEARMASARKNAPAAALPFSQLPPAAQLDILTPLYTKNLGGEPKFPESISAIKAKPELITAKIEFLSGELRNHIAVTEADLKALGQQRAANLQSVLLTGTQIDPERVFLVANDKAKNHEGAVRLEFSLR
jgi:hypothetical protein